MNPAEIMAMCTMIPFEDIKKLKMELEHGDPWPAEGYFDLFGRCQELWHVEISVNCPVHLREGFSPDVVESSEEQPRVLFLSLTSLMLSRINFNFKRGHSSWLPGWLKSRMRLCPLQQITITNCVLQRETLQTIYCEIRRARVAWKHLRILEEDNDSDYISPSPIPSPSV
ncbi:hypothetical protein DENSPDRAFT_842848 [Dentipellis sp. KUC8613]|nr:hypothetical protein DENSPDRAFT_842848 [Dentipellis sp. KUC8613]